MAGAHTYGRESSSYEGSKYIGLRWSVNYIRRCFIRSSARMVRAVYAATVAAATSDHGPFSPRVLTHRRA